MAVTRIWPVISNVSGVQSYIANPDKTVITVEEYNEMHTSDASYEAPEELCLVRGINCSPKHAVEQFNMVKEQYDKANNPIQAYHGCISFAEGEVTAKEAVSIAKEFVESVWGDNYQVLLAAHLNTNHLHCHYLINATSYVDGHMLHAEKAWFIFRQTADEICKKYGKSIIESPDRAKKKELTERESAAKDCLDRAMAKSKSFPEFLANIQSEPCKISFPMQLSSWSILPDGWTVPVITDKLGDDYKKDSIIERYPDAKEEVVRFTVPEVLERVDLKGYQSMVADKIRTVITDNMTYSDEEPSRTYLPLKVKKMTDDASKGLEVMVDNRITDKPMFDRFLLIQNQKLNGLQKRKNRQLDEWPVISELNSEIAKTEDAIRFFGAIRETFDFENVDREDVNVKAREKNSERGEFI